MIPDSGNTLDGIALPIQGIWVDERQHSHVGQATLRALSGGQYVFSVGTTGGRPITLIYTLPNTWIYASTIASLQALADQVGGQFTLLWESVTYTVMFRHQDPPALDFTYVDAPGVAIDAGVFNGQIKLFEVA